jgi:hypothetical protein
MNIITSHCIQPKDIMYNKCDVHVDAGCLGDPLYQVSTMVLGSILLLELHLFLMSLCSVKWGGNSWSPLKSPHKEYLKFKPLS